MKNCKIRDLTPGLGLFTLIVMAVLESHLCGASTEVPMKQFEINLPTCILQYSLPDEVAEKIPPFVQEKQLTDLFPDNPSYNKNGYIQIAGSLHDFDGPIWTGAYGSLQFAFIIHRRVSKYPQDISTVDGLEAFLKAWVHDENPSYVFNYSRKAINSRQWICQTHSNYEEWQLHGRKGTREEHQVYSSPIDANMYISIAFTTSEWVPGSASKWQPKADRFRQLIIESVLLRPKI